MYLGDDGDAYCDVCWQWFNLKRTRCFSFAAVYDSESGRLLSTDASNVGVGCAERMALWKLSDEHVSTPKVVVVAGFGETGTAGR